MNVRAMRPAEMENDAAQVAAEREPAVGLRGAPRFPGCRPFKLSREEVAAWERRIEFWDAETETAWEVRENSGAHEHPSRRLPGLCAVIAGVRGSGIECFGSVSLVQRDARGERRRILEADETVYLYPSRARLPRESAVAVGEHTLPDVVLEVDNTTDVRQGKLQLYEAWGFPEVWVEVPASYTPSRPRGLVPELRIYRLAGEGFRRASTSRAFSGWRAAEIHQALNEREMSAGTSEVLTRVGRGLGERDGTEPDDTPWLRLQREEGRAEGREEGHEQGVATAVDAILAARGFRWAEVVREVRQSSGMADEEVIAALLQCEDEADFRARLHLSRR